MNTATKVINYQSLEWYNNQISSLDKRLRGSDFDTMQGFCVGIHTMETLQRQRYENFGIVPENKTYQW